MSFWSFLNSGKGNPAFNMALDEALLETVAHWRKPVPVLRFYGWTETAASFGYFQKYADVERATMLRPLIRRPTGGGIVPHDADWTYSFVAPPDHEWHSLKAEESYQRIHEWIRSAFAKLGIGTELAPASRLSSLVTRHSSHASECFVGHAKYDLLWQAKKIAGAAQRRNKMGLLIQGSVQPPPISVARADWENAMLEVARQEFGASWQELKMGSGLAELAEQLARAKYSQAAYNRKR